jgi:beta-glucosidase
MLDPPASIPYNYIINGTSNNALNKTHAAAALEAAQKSICLYKNSKSVLPLDAAPFRSKPRSLALIGPQAFDTVLMMGNYACEDSIHTDAGCPPAISIADGMKSLVGVDSVATAPGCAEVICSNTSLFEEAATVAAAADVTIVILGLTMRCKGWIYPTNANGTKTNGPYCPRDPTDPSSTQEGEGRDRNTIELNQYQAQLVSRLREAIGPRKPLIGVLVHGGAIALGESLDKLDGLVDAWYPGEMGGQAIADVLFGKVNPAGRTPVTWYKSTADLPPMGTMDLYAHQGSKKGGEMEGGALDSEEEQGVTAAGAASNGLTYRYFSADVDFPFGYGLSYTEFEYSQMQVPSSVVACDTIHVSVTVTNIGKRDGDEVVQVYLRQLNASTPVPQVRLAAFDRVFLKAGASMTVKLDISPAFHSTVLSTATAGPEFYDPPVVVRAEVLEISAGGGQPGYFKGAATAHTSVSTQADLVDCK